MNTQIITEDMPEPESGYDREIARKAWEKGFEACEAYVMSISDGNSDDALLRNPYESEEA